MINRIFLAIALIFLFVSGVNGQKAFYGKLWANGQESECNWFFEDDRACMQLSFTTPENVRTDARVIMHATTGAIEIITYSNGVRSVYNTHVDSLKTPENAEQVAFRKVGAPADFQQLGSCQKYAARTLHADYQFYLLSVDNVNLKQFAGFFKDDEAFQWISGTSGGTFPVSIVKVAAGGELIRSFLVEEITDVVPATIWQ